MLIKNGMIHDAVNREAYVADILIADGKIKAIEKNYCKIKRPMI